MPRGRLPRSLAEGDGPQPSGQRAAGDAGQVVAHHGLGEGLHQAVRRVERLRLGRERLGGDPQRRPLRLLRGPCHELVAQAGATERGVHEARRRHGAVVGCVAHRGRGDELAELVAGPALRAVRNRERSIPRSPGAGDRRPGAGRHGRGAGDQGGLSRRADPTPAPARGHTLPVARSAVRISGSWRGSRARVAAKAAREAEVPPAAGPTAVVEAHLHVAGVDRHEQGGAPQPAQRRVRGWRSPAAQRISATPEA